VILSEGAKAKAVQHASHTLSPDLTKDKKERTRPRTRPTSRRAMLAKRRQLPPLTEPRYDFNDVPRCARDMSGSAVYHCSSRQLWESRMAEILMICNEASRRHKGVRVPGATNKPLSLEYVADRLDTDDPVSGYLVRTDDKFRRLQVHGRKTGARVCVCGGGSLGWGVVLRLRSGRAESRAPGIAARFAPVVRAHAGASAGVAMVSVLHRADAVSHHVLLSVYPLPLPPPPPLRRPRPSHDPISRNTRLSPRHPY
jgi:hypothetical protein